MPVREEDVLRLDIPVNHPVPVGMLQGVADLPRQRDHLVREERAPVHPGPKRFTVDERHDVVEKAGGLAGIDQPEDMGMLEPGRDGDFPKKPLGAQGRGQVGAKDLHRHLAAVLLVASQEDGGHATLADRTLEGVPTGQRQSERPGN